MEKPMVLPSKLAVDGFLQNIKPSPDGRYIYAALISQDDSIFKALATGQTPHNPIVQHVLYDVSAGRKTVIAEFPMETSPFAMNWLSDSSGLHTTVSDGENPGNYILWLNGRLSKIPGVIPPRVMGSIIKVGTVFVTNSWVRGPGGFEDLKLHVYSSDFSSSKTYDLPEKVHPFIDVVPNQMAVYVRNDSGTFIAINLMTGQFSEIHRPAPPAFVEPKFEVYVAEKMPLLIGRYGWNHVAPIVGSGSHQEETGTPLQKISNSSSADYAVVAKDAYSGGLMEGDRFIWHAKERGLFISEIIEVDKNILQDSKDAAERTVLISNAKQVATGMMIYSSDYDGQFPPINNWTENLMPYMKNRDIMNGFVYMLGDKNFADITDPANTVLGYIEGKDGRAVDYVDGHVKWEPSKNPLLLAEQKHIAGVLR
ncbi:MAG: hypothetical protein R2688_06890 [Fimbriimonadaceae bacterium]